MANDIVTWLVLLSGACALFACAYVVHVQNRAINLKILADTEALLEDWAERNGLDLRKQERCYIGPWLFTSNAQRTFRVSVQGRDGRLRRGHVLCGGYFSGAKYGLVKVRWDLEVPSETPSARSTGDEPRDNPLWDDSIDG